MRKQDKLRPYRIDYFIHDEMVKDRALVRSACVRDVTAKAAEKRLAESLGLNRTFTVIRSYRFYKKLSVEPKRKVYKTVDELLPAKKAVEVMTQIEDAKKLPPKFGDPAPATVVDPTTLPPDHPDHVCTDKCYDIVVIPPDAVPQVLAAAKAATEKFAPCKWHGGKYIDKDGRCTALDSGSAYPADGGYQRALAIERTVAQYAKAEPAVLEKKEYVTDVVVDEDKRTAWGGPVEHYAAGELALSFPDKPVIPTQPAVFDDSALDIDKAAPVLYPKGEVVDREACDCGVCDPAYTGAEEYPAAEVVEDVVQKGKKGAYIALVAALAAIGGLVYVYFHYLAK